MKLRHLMLALLGCALLYAANRATLGITAAFPGVESKAEGHFIRDGHFRGGAVAPAVGVRLWGSWAGSDENTGTLVLGPFPAPAVLRFAVGGYPARAGNQLHVERADTKAILPVAPLFDVGERWRVMEFPLPADWIGKPVTLIARDEARQLGGWLAVSEPIRDGRISGNAALFESLAAWSLNGILFGLPWFALLRWLAARAWLPPQWLPLAAAAGVAIGGYLAFWAYFAGPLLGKLFSGAVLLAGLAGALRKNSGAPKVPRELFAVPRLLVAIGACYVALLHLFPSSLEFHALAANRYSALPGDNTLPHNSARDLFQGRSLKSPVADWLSSDRPPLPAGCLLLVRPVTALIDFDERTANGTAALWWQSIWVFAAYGLLRTLALAPARALAWTALLAFTGFFTLNTTFTWPKLSAAAFACGAFALWALPERTPPSRRDLVLGAVLAALAWLSHGGVAFSFLALLPWMVWRAARGEARGWLLAAITFACLAAPWLAYQKFYDPPGNRLLKWHLGGQTAKDDRGTWQTIREGYAALTWEEIAARRIANLKLLVEGDWNWWRDFAPGRAQARRNDEFFNTARALNAWLLGFAALPFVLWRRKLGAAGPAHGRLAAWTVASLLVWCAVMFLERSTIVHQGSYATMLVLFVLLSAWCEAAGTWTLGVLAVVQIFSFAITWLPPAPVLREPLSATALALALAAAGTIVALVGQAHRSRDAQPPKE